jgi:hypothetical protein
MKVTEFGSFSITEAGKASGLNPSVLRIWELRYGWPSPKRQSNGFRIYHRYLIDDIRKVAILVREGTPISSIIRDGQPRWPLDAMSPPSPRLLPLTRRLPSPSDVLGAGLHRDLVQAFADRNPCAVKELLQRICWTVRSCDEPITALVPTVVALSELRKSHRIMPEEDAISAYVRGRCMQLMRMQPCSGSALLVVPVQGCDQALAALAAVILCHRGIPARPWFDEGMPRAAFVVAGDSRAACRKQTMQAGRVTVVREGIAQNALCLADLLAPTMPIPWGVTKAAPSSTAGSIPLPALTIDEQIKRPTGRKFEPSRPIPPMRSSRCIKA